MGLFGGVLLTWRRIMRAALPTQPSLPAPGASLRWTCVVEPEQVWRSVTGATYRVAQVLIAAGAMASASVVLEPIGGGPREPISAAVLCQGDSGWTRLPDPPKLHGRTHADLPRAADPEGDETVWLEKTYVGLGPKART